MVKRLLVGAGLLVATGMAIEKVIEKQVKENELFASDVEEDTDEFVTINQEEVEEIEEEEIPNVDFLKEEANDVVETVKEKFNELKSYLPHIEVNVYMPEKKDKK